VMKLDKPYPPSLILGGIAAGRAAIALDRKTILAHEVNGDLGSQYLATHTECVGPYRLRQWRAGEVVVLEANGSHWGPAPRLKQVIVRHVPEAGTQRLLLSQGDIDVAVNLSPEDLGALERSPDVNIARYFQNGLFYWGFNNSDPLFANAKVRLAMRYLVDYQALSQSVMKGTGVPRQSFVPIGAFGALNEREGQPFKLDLMQARQLLNEAGHAAGFQISMLLAPDSAMSLIAEHIQQNAAKVGVTIAIERMATSQLLSRMRGRNFQTAISRNFSDMPDAHDWASKLIRNPDNRASAGLVQSFAWKMCFYSADANQRIDAALIEGDATRRAQMYEGLQRTMMQEGPAAYLFQPIVLDGVRKNLHNWRRSPYVKYSVLSKD